MGTKIRGFQNYFNLLGDLFIPGVLLQFCVWLRVREHTFRMLFWFVVSTLIFLNQAFRYKLLLLFAPVFLLWLFYLKRRPKLAVATIIMVLSIALSGIVSVWRLNSRGSNISLNDLTPIEIFLSSFEEAGVFFTTSAAISKVPEKYSYVGLAPVLIFFTTKDLS